jgi:hypothetical protein
MSAAGNQNGERVHAARAAADIETSLSELDGALGQLCANIRESIISRPVQEGGGDFGRVQASVTSEKLEVGWRKIISMKVLIKQLDPDSGAALAWQRRHKHFARLLDRLASDHTGSSQAQSKAANHPDPTREERKTLLSENVDSSSNNHHHEGASSKPSPMKNIGQGNAKDQPTHLKAAHDDGAGWKHATNRTAHDDSIRATHSPDQR